VKGLGQTSPRTPFVGQMISDARLLSSYAEPTPQVGRRFKLRLPSRGGGIRSYGAFFSGGVVTSKRHLSVAYFSPLPHRDK